MYNVGEHEAAWLFPFPTAQITEKKEKPTKMNKLKQERNLFADMHFELNT